jgi:carboxylesterase
MNTKYLLISLLVSTACSQMPDINNDTMLDGNQIFDPSLYHPELYLVSQAIANPSTVQKNTPVVIASHGYSATTFEWDEFRSYADSVGDVLVSQVLLGGHGRTYAEFKASTWEDWQEPILTEYNALRAKGYTNISFAGSSTSCPLVMDLLKKGSIGAGGLKHIFMIDPIVISSDKTITLIGLVGPMMGYIETTNTPTEEGHWYHFRPQETLNQLLKLIDKSRKDLQAGFKLPAGTQLKIYKSIKDPSADPVSAVLIYKGLKNSDDSNIEVEMIGSELHVMTRLNGRDGVTQRDRNNQLHIFDDMHLLLLN